ncbi:MAG: nuclear transport factor 2 family protein [Woeseiaceae bacterium]
MQTLELGREFMRHVQAGNIEGAKSCLHSDAEIWHNYDNVVQTVAENMALLALMIDKCADRQYTIHYLEEINGGYLQRHQLTVTGHDGTSVTEEVVALIKVTDGKITRVDEWLDPTGIRQLLAG